MALRDSDPAEVGGYRIDDRLGSGGMGVVYLARSASGRRLAVKVVHGQYADDDEFRARFRREVAAARQVSGAFTAPVVDADADAPRPWMATLYIPGEDLGTHVRRHGPLPPDRLRELAAGLTEALRDIHRAGVVHRDLKPANVMLAEDGPRVIDFGISRAAEAAGMDALTQTGRVMGTPPFMSPEQFAAPHEVGPATDLFSLGAVLVYAATRRGPFDSPSPWETATRVVEGTPDLEGVPDDLLPFVRFCLEKHPKSRPGPDELLHLLRDGRLPDPRPEPTPPGTEPARPRRRHRWPAAVAATAVLAAVAATAVLAHDGSDTPHALPAGWHTWHRQATNPLAGNPNTMGPSGPFSRCVLADRSLLCAGDGIMAARFALADGRNVWTRPMDPTPAEISSSGGGTIIGTRPGTVYVYGADDRDIKGGDEPESRTRYTVQALDPDTGRPIWRTVVADDVDGMGPDINGAVTVPAGVVTTYGNASDSYALLDATDGGVRWHHKLPTGADPDCQLSGAAGQVYLVCHTSDGNGEHPHTTAAQLDPATGKARWRITAVGQLYLFGQTRGHLVFGADPLMSRLTGLTLVDASSHVLTTVRLSAPRTASGVHLVRGTLYLTLTSGSVHAIDPRTGRELWQSNSTVEQPGPPTASATRLYLASPTGRLAALDLRTGRVTGTLPGRDDSDSAGAPDNAAAPVLSGDALYVPYGMRAVYSVDVRSL
ncbi:PQQ-binding-like beta-propeller repeat protein [Streptomyces sp. 5-8]|uniref:PQQ-binding-like beta-propeller repeat protein n=1 Tax=Streptomyces musisoli TaxID=2802280 RepID=A0ABS1NY48_9ACTN|nr:MULTISPECIES: serine/threonine-protein kinase [Streptomyces]MBL1105032.1 PQQ-binding-like beta-propeller repeat protein [Streptomyces musisoli]MBY8841120.1 PQQ-binding-like beta-propeller repeat protein [Streptomyces sp. SP2-10]